MDCLEFYHTGGKGANGVIKEQPVHDETSHGADAFRIFAEAVSCGMVGKNPVKRQERKLPALFYREKQQRKQTKGVPDCFF
jgi:hypothetical protein